MFLKVAHLCFLLFESASRFSIDIDICMEESEFENKEALELFFKENIKPPFIDVTRDKDRNSHGGRDIKATHYLFSITQNINLKRILFCLM